MNKRDFFLLTGIRNVRSFWPYAVAHDLCFAVWILPSIVGVALARELQLNEAAFGILVATPILVGTLARFFVGATAARGDARPAMLAVRS